MVKQKVVLVLVLAVAFLALTGGAEAIHTIVGTVNDAADGTPADGHTVIIYYLGDEANNKSDTIGPTGNQNNNNMYMCDVESIPGHAWAPDDVIYARVIDNGDGYTAVPVSVVTTSAGYDVEPDMTLQAPPPPIVSDPQAIPPKIALNTGVSELRVTVTKTYYDIDTVTVNLSQIGGAWNHTMNDRVNISENTFIFNCTTNSSVVGSFYLAVNATDIMGNSNTSVSIPLEVVNATQFDFTLIKKPGSTGKNWVSIPLNTEITNASALMQAIPNCDAVSRWNPNTQQSESWISLMGGMGTNFDIVLGEGYEVSVTTNTTFSILGTIASIDSIDLIKKSGSTGKNWIGLPYGTTMSNASTLMQAIPNCDAVSRWNQNIQQSESWIALMGGMGTNFDIVAGEGYEVSVTTNTTWTPV